MKSKRNKLQASTTSESHNIEAPYPGIATANRTRVIRMDKHHAA